MKRYVVGFMFSDEGDRVVLIRKNRPDWQAGKLNGVGGKIEENELPGEAMIREFYEETGVKTTPQDWKSFCYMKGKDFHDFEIFFYQAFNTFLLGITQTTTDEPILRLPIGWLAEQDPVPNLKWLIPLAQSKKNFADVTYAE